MKKDKIIEYVNEEMGEFKNSLIEMINPEPIKYLFPVIKPIIGFGNDMWGPTEIIISLKLNITDSLGNIYNSFRVDTVILDGNFKVKVDNSISDFKDMVLKYLLHQDDGISVIGGITTVGSIGIKNAYKIAKILTCNAGKQF